MRPPNGRLSTRELKIALCLARGLSNKEIAKKVGISAKTVATERAQLMLKLIMDSLTE